MIPLEALKIALIEEMKSLVLYEKMSKEHPAIQEICEFLIDEETKHIKLIEKKIHELSKL